MAKTVIGYFRNIAQASKVVQKLVDDNFDPEAIKLVFDEKPGAGNGPEFDNTIESSPMIAFKEAFFGADFTEEDATYYNKLLNDGDALLSVYVSNNEEGEREAEDRTAKTIGNAMGKAGAYDHEVRKIYSNRAGLTTYPQNRYLDPVGPNKLNQDRTYDSRSPLNGEVSNVIGVRKQSDSIDKISKMGGRQILNATEVLARSSKG